MFKAIVTGLLSLSLCSSGPGPARTVEPVPDYCPIRGPGQVDGLDYVGVACYANSIGQCEEYRLLWHLYVWSGDSYSSAPGFTDWTHGGSTVYSFIDVNGYFAAPFAVQLRTRANCA